MIFADRVDAGRQLAGRLKQYAGAPETVVFGIPRGGVVVAAEVARELGLPLDVAVAAKVGAPANREFAAGAVSADGVVFVNPGAGYSQAEVESFSGEARAKVAAQTDRLRRGMTDARIEGKTAILVDDGLATGLTAKAAATWLRREGARRVIIAAPVAPADTVDAMRSYADDVVVVDVPSWFGAVGQFYETFGQTSDAEVDAVLLTGRTADPHVGRGTAR